MTFPQIGHFAVLSSLGEGAFGKVYHVKDVYSRELCALKVYRRKSTKYAASEIKIFNIITKELAEINYCLGHKGYFLFDGQECIQLPFLPMDLYDFAYTQRIYKFDLNELRHIGYQICHALEFLHNKQIIHNDIKPENILLCDVTVHEETHRLIRTYIRVADFGHSIYRIRQGRHNFTPTKQYCAPEILINDLLWTYGADMWSLGCLLAELYFGKPLFDLTVENDNHAEHIGMIQHLIGDFPETMQPPKRVERRLTRLQQSQLQKQKLLGEIDTSTPTPTPVYRVSSAFLPLKNHRLEHDSSDQGKFFDVVMRMLVIAPGQRISANAALALDFFKRSPDYKCYIQPRKYHISRAPLAFHHIDEIDAVREIPAISCADKMTTLKSTGLGANLRFLVLSDLHGNWNAEQIIQTIVDHGVHAFIFAGNIINNCSNKPNIDSINSSLNAIHKIAALVPTFIVAGTCDSWIESLTRAEIDELFLPAEYVENEYFTFRGLKIFATPMTAAENLNELNHFARYNPINFNPYGNLPNDVDIIIAHGGPTGMQTISTMGGIQYGDPHLRRLIEKPKPKTNLKAVIFGHVHDTVGFRVLNDVVCLNASQMANGGGGGTAGSPSANAFVYRPFILTVSD